MTIKTVLFGLGNMGSHHVRTLDADARFSLVALVDPSKKTMPFPIRSKPQFFSTIDQLQNIDYDVAVVATPTETHYALVHTLLENNKHVLVEKPAATNADDCLSLCMLAKKQNRHLCVGNIERCNPVIQALKEVVEANLIGEIIHIHAMRSGRYPAQVAMGNNVLLDLAIHEFDILQMLFDTFEVVNALCHRTHQEETLDSAEILMQINDAATASIHVNWLTPTKTRVMRLTGTKGTCIIDYISQSCSVFADNLNEKIPQNFMPYTIVQDTFCEKLICTVEKKEPLKEQLNQFFAFLQGNKHVLCHGEEMAKALWLVEECIKKARFIQHTPQAPLETLLDDRPQSTLALIGKM